MPGPSNSREAAILDNDLDSSTYWLGLSTTTPSETGSNIVEPTEGNYTRVAVGVSAWDPAVGGAPTEKVSAVELSFTEAVSDWASGGNLGHWVLMSASVSGTMEYSGPLGTPKPVLTGDTARFSAGELRILLGNPEDTYE